MTTSQKTFSQEEYDKHGNILYEIGKASAFQSVLKTEVQWSVKMFDKNWDLDTGILKVSNVGIGTTTTGFFPGENVKGLESGAIFSVSVFSDDTTDKYNEGDIFESEADLLIDFSESNPFGSF